MSSSLDLLIARINDVAARLALLETQENGAGVGVLASTPSTVVLRGPSGEVYVQDLNIDGLAKRIRADFSNGTVSNRTMFQGTATNAQTAVYAIPNGSSVTAQFSAANSSDPNNAAIIQLITAADRVYIGSTKTGSGTLLPLDLLVNGVQRLRINTDGRLDISLPNSFGGRYIHGYPFSRVLTFTNSWAQSSLHSTDNYVSYHQDATGKVFLSGAMSGGANNNAAFTLPAGLRPSSTELFCIATSGGIGRVDVNAAGNVTPVSGSGTYYLDGISFYPSAYDSLFTAASFVNSWVDYAGGYMACGYYKDPLGRVHTRGLMKSGTIGSAAFTLPAGSRVWRNSVMATMSNAVFGRLDYYANGNIVPVVGNNAWFSVSGLMFPASDVAPEEAWFPVEQQGFWVDYDGVNWPIASAWIDATGRVHLNGLVKSGTINNTAHLLPVGMRPPRRLFFPAASNDAYGRLELSPASAILPAVGSNVWFSYGGAHFLPIN